MRRAAVVGAAAALALWAVAVSSTPADADTGTSTDPRPDTDTPAGMDTLTGTDADVDADVEADVDADAVADEDGGPGARSGARGMPVLLGASLWRVFTALAPRTRLDVHDVSGDDRRVLWPPNWRVCTQHPAAGAERGPRGRVVVGVVKKGETCPARVTSARR
ncbi:hypothetical protein [Streptomyces roseoviridis]|uniref:PASTA domain-containing protein n=1 Tax=Streptomyces roseoviridis TaxID=67361 RepID=A0ABV5QYE2_9ACTN